MAKELIKQYDEYYLYNGHALLNQIYQDDEGFYKNGWKWGVVDGKHVYDVAWVDGLTSASYARFPEAFERFKQLVNEKIEQESIKKLEKMLLFS